VGDEGEQGRLRRIAMRLDEAFAQGPLPKLTEPERLADRLATYRGFRDCAKKVYIARRQAAGRGVPVRAASIGDAAVEECAVRGAVADRDATLCERLATDYAGPRGETPLAALRCWDTRARVLGLPDECPVLWMPDDVLGRNPECLAAARRDATLCEFVDSPQRCRAILSGDEAPCVEALRPCHAAATYWAGLIPNGSDPPLVPADLGATFSVRRAEPGSAPTVLELQAPPRALGVSWPGRKLSPPRTLALPTPAALAYWGNAPPDGHAQITWHEQAGLKLSFNPRAVGPTPRQLDPPGSGAAATLVLVLPDGARCTPETETRSTLTVDATNPGPGTVVTGSVTAEKLRCNIGPPADVQGKFRVVVTDLR